MPDAWYYAESGQAKGPLTFERLCEHLSALQDADQVLVWKHGLEVWKKAKELPQFEEFIARPPPLPASECRCFERPKTSLTAALFGFSGRICRTEYFAILLASIAAIVLLAMLASSIGDETVSAVVLILSAPILLWIRLAVTCKRFHDYNRSGWNCIGLAVPLLNIYYFFELLFRRGTPKANDYGPTVYYFSENPPPN